MDSLLFPRDWARQKIVSTIPVRCCNIHTLSLLAHSLRDDLVTEVKTVSWLVVVLFWGVQRTLLICSLGEKGVGTAKQYTLWEWETKTRMWETLGDGTAKQYTQRFPQSVFRFPFAESRRYAGNSRHFEFQRQYMQMYRLPVYRLQLTILIGEAVLRRV